MSNNFYKLELEPRHRGYKLTSVEIVDIEKKNWSLVANAKSYLAQQKWEKAIALFWESRSICVAQQWLEGVRYADDMIDKASRALQTSLKSQMNPDAPTDQQIRLACPKCKKIGSIRVHKQIIEDMLREKGDSLIPLRIFPGDVCDHEFAIFVDARFKAR
ncbi:MAG: hypothetical protein RBG13Loki_4367 [Promethearchaeota archaeon CR_4]|nr:MAG: hypothetical protein RBG13Loki_4367 [Candidatus Lokiarchaeota archaeon CR_4]